MARNYLKASICSLLSETGFDTTEHIALETLVEMTGSFITELGRSTTAHAELAGRVEPLMADVILAVVNMGISLKDLESHAFRANRTKLLPPTQSIPPKQLSILQAGTKQPHPPYIPSYLPQFPDPHAYIRTPTHKKPVTEYEAIREKAAIQKRSVEKALNKYMTKSNPTENLFFNQENDCFPLIAAKPYFPSYLTALIPNDQVFDEEEEDDMPEPSRKKAKEDKSVSENETGEESVKADEPIDNPYLRAVKLPVSKNKPKL